MPRPRKPRCVEQVPGVTYFKPCGIPFDLLEEVTLTVEELEAVRLKDIEDLDGEQAAERMSVSRPTFQRILDCARKKIATALVGGKALSIQGGDFEINPSERMCPRCRHKWHRQHGSDEAVCPTCSQVPQQES